MKMTDRELNNIVDDTADEIRSEKLDSAIVEGAAQRVWTRMTGEQVAIAAGVKPVEQIRNCDDFQALIPAYLQGHLSSARTMLLEDHTRECVPCRKALKQARHGNQSAIRLQEQQAKAAAAHYRTKVLRWAVAAVLVLGLGLFAWPWVQRSINSLYTLNAVVEAAQGGVYKVTGDKTQAVKMGEKLLRGERIRTAKNSGAVVKLGDGTLVEMRERSEFSVSDTTAGETINLERGQVIVQAAKQRDRKLFVQADDSLVSVTGTIFSVNSGAKGARVSVVEGEVHVDNAGKSQVLRAGDQTTTHESIERVSVKDEIAWSRDAARYLGMLDAIRSEIDRQLAMPGNRYSTRLLDLAPENTVLYVAIPNVAETLARANEILQANMQNNAELRGWWEKEQTESSKRRGFNQAIELMREFGSHFSDEIVIAAAANAKGSDGPGEPVVMAEVRDEAAFRSFLEGQLKGLDSKKKHVRILNDLGGDPMNNAAGGKAEFFVSIAGGVVAVSPSREQLQSLAARMRQGAKPFASTPFYAQIANLYHDGAGLVIAADLDRLVMQSLRQEKDAVAAQQLGVTDLRYFIVEIKEKDGKPYNRAVVSFRENQRGVTSWLAQPGPMGALEFISPDASLVAAFVVKEPTALADDLFETLKKADPKAWEALQSFQTEQAIDLRNDVAAPLGGEYAFAFDGPVLPTPSWKVILQVDDQQHLQQTLELTVGKINAEMARHGKKGLAWARTDSGGRVFHTLKSLDFGLEVNYTYAYGYFIAAPSRALVENAIKYKESGHTLLGSPKFKATLPEDKQVNFSVMVYQNAGSILSSVGKVVGGVADANAPKGVRNTVKGLLGAKAGLAYVYALNDRMVMSVNSEDGPVGLSPSDLLGLPGSSGIGHIISGAMR